MPEYPYKYEELDPKKVKEMKEKFGFLCNGIIKCTPSNLIMPGDFVNYGEKIYNMEVRKDDTWVVTYPKTGTTWTQAAVWAINNDANFEKLNEINYGKAWQFVEFNCIAKGGVQHLQNIGMFSAEQAKGAFMQMGRQYEEAIAAPSPRYIKTHLPLCHLPPNLLDTAKVVYVVRNPRDVMVSFYYHNVNLLIHDFKGDFKEFFKYAMEDLHIYDPYWPHVLEAWAKKDHPNMLFLFFEELKKDFPGSIRRLAKFLGKSLTDKQVERINFELSVENMKKNPHLNYESIAQAGMMKKGGAFIRKGGVGDWKNHFTPEMLEQFEIWNKKGKRGIDFKFPGE